MDVFDARFVVVPFSAPRLRLVAELKLFCRCTAFLFQGHSLQSAFGGWGFPGTGRLRLPVPRLTIGIAFQAFVCGFVMQVYVMTGSSLCDSFFWGVSPPTSPAQSGIETDSCLAALSSVELRMLADVFDARFLVVPFSAPRLRLVAEL